LVNARWLREFVPRELIQAFQLFAVELGQHPRGDQALDEAGDAARPVVGGLDLDTAVLAIGGDGERRDRGPIDIAADPAAAPRPAAAKSACGRRA
jgi:hypothetical protein